MKSKDFINEAANAAQQAAIAVNMKKQHKKPKSVDEQAYCDACDRPASKCICEPGVAEGVPTDDELFNTDPVITRIRNRMEELHDTEEYEPEEVYDMVADEYGMSYDELMDLLDSDSELGEGTVYDLEKEYGYQKPASKPRRSAPSDYPYSPAEDDAYFNDIFRKKRLAAQKAERDADHDRLATGTNEAESEPNRQAKQQTATKQKSKLDPNVFGPKADQPVAKVDPLDDLKKNAGMGGKPELNINKASQSSTLSKTSGLATDDMANMLSKMKDISIDRDLEAYPTNEPTQELSVDVNTQNLPAVAGQAMQAAGLSNPEFHQVANLPGNMADQIRQLGKSLFGSLTMTPTKRIYVVANLGGQGPNTSQEVNAVANFLQKNGTDRGPGNIDFEQIMPGYKAQTHMFSAAGIRWMLVKDFAGQYIYCWPEDDSHDSAAGLDNDKQDLPRLK